MITENEVNTIIKNGSSHTNAFMKLNHNQIRQHFFIQLNEYNGYMKDASSDILKTILNYVTSKNFNKYRECINIELYRRERNI